MKANQTTLFSNRALEDDTPTFILAADEGFIPHTATTLSSLFQHQTEPVHAIILNTGLPENSYDRLTRALSPFPHTLSVIEFDPSVIEPFGHPAFWGNSTYLRLAIPELLPQQRIVYLDSDLLIRCSLAPLFTMDLGENVLAGVPDIPASILARDPELNWLNLPPGDPYINAGVLVMDLEKMRQLDFLQAALDWHQVNGKKALFPDQCLLNSLLAGKKTVFKFRYNIRQTFLSPWLFRTWTLSGRPGVFHFNGLPKPWHHEATPRLSKLWFSFADDNQFPRDEVLSHVPPEETIAHLRKYLLDITRAYKKALRRLIRDRVESRIRHLFGR